ncbi:hypothetical protein BJ741DRAFT_668965 [Chytriomyces cf. hyalinus JEL632]|nr:hypothetical protein BJ741DRAFT_668965 [Chytriomyces cf. hyalinus JEL632]
MTVHPVLALDDQVRLFRLLTDMQPAMPVRSWPCDTSVCHASLPMLGLGLGLFFAPDFTLESAALPSSAFNQPQHPLLSCPDAYFGVPDAILLTPGSEISGSLPHISPTSSPHPCNEFTDFNQLLAIPQFPPRPASNRKDTVKRPRMSSLTSESAQLASCVQQSVQQHKTIHPAQQNKRFKCTLTTCLKAYNSKNGLRYHMRNHHQE